MKIETLEEFCDLADSLNFSATARKRYVSHSSLSKHISALEKELGCKLFLRTSREVHLTPEGQCFLDHARAILDARDAALADMEQLLGSQREVIRFGYLHESAIDYLLDGCLAFKKAAPETKLVLYSMGINSLEEALVAHDIDVALGVHIDSLDPKCYLACELFEDRFAILVPKNNPLFNHESLSIEDLKDMRIVARDLSRATESVDSFSSIAGFFEQVGLLENIAGDLTDARSLSLTLRMNNDLLSIQPLHMAKFFGEDFAFVPLEGFDMPLYTSVFWRTDNDRPSINKLASCMKRACTRALA